MFENIIKWNFVVILQKESSIEILIKILSNLKFLEKMIRQYARLEVKYFDGQEQKNMEIVLFS